MRCLNLSNLCYLITHWECTFMCPLFWVSEQGSNFINETLSTLASTFNTTQPPTISYSLWAKRTVEQLERDVQSALRSILGQSKLAPHACSTVIEAIPIVISECPLARPTYNPDKLVVLRLGLWPDCTLVDWSYMKSRMSIIPHSPLQCRAHELSCWSNALEFRLALARSTYL